MTKKKVGVCLPTRAQSQSLEDRWSLELEILDPVAEIVELRADTATELADRVSDLDAFLTSWGLRIDEQLIGAMRKCAVIGVGSVGVDMVDIAAATAAGIVVTNVPDVFIEEVADHAMMLLLAVAADDAAGGTNGSGGGLGACPHGPERQAAPFGPDARTLRLRQCGAMRGVVERRPSG